MTVLLMAGSPTAPSRSQALPGTVGQRLLPRGGVPGFDPVRLSQVRCSG